SQGFVPEADEDERTKQPLRNSEEPTRAPDAEYRVHPGDERAVADEGNQRLRLVVPPLLIPEQEEDYHHRCPKQMVIEVPLQQARLAQERRQQRGDGSHPDLLCRSLDRSSRRRPFRPSTGVIVTALIRAATDGPAGLASEIGAAGPASGRPAPRNGLEIGPSPSALRRQRRAVVRSPPACRALALVIRGRGMERPLTHQPVRGAASRRAWPRRKGAKAHAGRR